MAVSHNNATNRDHELLSAYVDGELSDHERETLERRLTDDSTLRARLEELRTTVSMLRDLPRLKAPRDFTLDPAVFRQTMPWWQRLVSFNALMQISGALGTAAAVVLITLVVLWNGTTTSEEKSQPREEAASQMVAPTQAVAILPTPSPMPMLMPTAVPLYASDMVDDETAIGESLEEPMDLEVPAAQPPTTLAGTATSAPATLMPTDERDDGAFAAAEGISQEPDSGDNAIAPGGLVGEEEMDFSGAASDTDSTAPAAAPALGPLPSPPDQSAFREAEETPAEAAETTSLHDVEQPPEPAVALAPESEGETQILIPTEVPYAAGEPNAIAPADAVQAQSESGQISDRTPPEDVALKTQTEDDQHTCHVLLGISVTLLVVSLALFALGLRRSRQR